ncbi:sensor histidine kinase [Candidatus Magnetaquicoccus inordinatus]|uniref:sensor histidine kinase n=1 Tax=Candidatus Magnetaquicoccus inordinatus TaxID=2496818 RepID=UPI00102AF689|nr:ATP-binding protein [Candidatus Magnetaquicoccus inordinatus]
MTETNEQERERLIQELERTNQELQQFAYIVSHDLKAPLRAIHSLVQWIAEDYGPLFDDDGREQLDLLQGRVRRMDQLIEGVLHYSRIGRVREEWIPVNLHKMVTQIIDLLAPPAHITIRLENRLPVVMCEGIRMGQVMQNLLSNAIKFMDKAHGEIAVRCVEEESLYRFIVADNGPGIPAKDHERIFQIFQTLHSGDSYGSAGIGLTLVKKIVELHGGEVHVFSPPRQSSAACGTEFEFTLPKRPLEEGAEEEGEE